MKEANRFRTVMSVVIGIAGLIWLALAIRNTRDGGFPWTGLVIFLIVLAAINIGRTRR
jgi:hypothetical protein